MSRASDRVAVSRASDRVAVSGAPGRVAVLGGGVAGLAAAVALAEAGQKVTVLEAGTSFGGLAGGFQNDHGVFPLGYHHVLRLDRTLLFVLDELGLRDRLRFRRVRVVFRVGGDLYDLGRPKDFLAYPLPLRDKAAFVRLMLRSFVKPDFRDWEGKTARDLVERWGSRRLREEMFEPLTRVKFDLPTDEVSGAWLGARLHYREGSSALGYLPGTNWTHALCDGLAERAKTLGVTLRTRARVTALDGGTVVEEDGTRTEADRVVSTLPIDRYAALAPDDASPGLRTIAYTALVSVIAAMKLKVPRDFYWMTILERGFTASGIFLLDALNPTIGRPGWRYVNFVTHARTAEGGLFDKSDDELHALYDDDLRRAIGSPTEVAWRVVNRVKRYSPILTPDYVNPPVRSATRRNVFFAGNYRTFPSIVSTGTAMASGFEAAAALLADAGRDEPPVLRRWRSQVG